VISDVIKPGSAEAIASLKNSGIHRTVMLTGDAKNVADEVAEKIGIDENEIDDIGDCIGCVKTPTSEPQSRNLNRGRKEQRDIEERYEHHDGCKIDIGSFERLYDIRGDVAGADERHDDTHRKRPAGSESCSRVKEIARKDSEAADKHDRFETHDNVLVADVLLNEEQHANA
ncbi:MAG: HAD family hydrolase, partial [Clostridia bacterium]|nr:HAD family hydrolase [Clostridia bacterium]